MPETANTRLLLVDDDEAIRDTLTLIPQHGRFEVQAASNVNDALRLITTQSFDVLVSDLHMPAPGDGLTVVSAMRSSNPKAVTIIFSAYPEMKRTAAAMQAQADDVLVKPTAIGNLVDLIRQRLANVTTDLRVIVSAATILEEDSDSTIRDCLSRVGSEPEIFTVVMDDESRSAHLPQLFRGLIARLRQPLPLGRRALISAAASQHGMLRREQGYTAAMMVEESRMLQVSIFQTLQNNLSRVNFSLLMVGVMEIADEVESQLAQAMTSYVSESKKGLHPTQA